MSRSRAFSIQSCQLAQDSAEVTDNHRGAIRSPVKCCHGTVTPPGQVFKSTSAKPRNFTLHPSKPCVSRRTAFLDETRLEKRAGLTRHTFRCRVSFCIPPDSIW
ncbi:hypothetical protein JCGZ_05948 [Jatropha curcas]|uniref:Uncharacterized protein n=1 Tax=Jatropha curcas TaxID=180498 RepID=A0A067L082_JATCU|nr:hypothetical protein JCGZ_05948 [Jatropha curcas]